jgi:hypothetical protein
MSAEGDVRVNRFGAMMVGLLLAGPAVLSGWLPRREPRVNFETCLWRAETEITGASISPPRSGRQIVSTSKKSAVAATP